MLLEFKTANYKSFKEELTFSLIPAQKQKGLDYSIAREKINKKVYKGLSSAVIYGANAAGKTNIIGAMDTFKSIIIRGNIRNDEDAKGVNIAAKSLELIPNNTLIKVQPVSFSIKFIEASMLIEYAFSLDLGFFLDKNYKRKILQETLKINENLVFKRSNELQIDNLDIIKDYLTEAFKANQQGAIALAQGSLNDEELFLTNGFKTIFSVKLSALILNWLSSKFIVVYHSNLLRVVGTLTDPQKNSFYVEETINEAAKLFGITANALGYVNDEETHKAQLCSLVKDRQETAILPAEIFESYGTIRFVNIFPLIMKVLLEGGILIADEFDASIHPMAVMNIITIFHNDEINKHHAQLVFNTHNPIFLNANLFRRDEIKFVERDHDTHCSMHYSLSDFGTAGENGVRKNEDYMKNYFIDRYGALDNIDFSSCITKFIKKQNERNLK